MALRPAAFEAALNAWIARLRGQALAETGVDRPIIAIDGKSARRSHDASGGLGPPHVVTAWAGEYGLALGQEVRAARSGEIPAVPESLKEIDVRGGVVTIDAMGARKVIAEQILRGQADYVPALKGDHESLHQAVIAHLAEQLEGGLEGAEELTTTDQGHGREEQRTCPRLPAPADLPGRGGWKGPKSVAPLRSRRVRGDREGIEVRDYLGSLPVGVGLFARAARGHWSAGDACHRALEVALREDDSRVRERVLGANITWPYRFTRSILKRHPGRRRSLIMERRGCGWSDTFLVEVIAALTCEWALALAAVSVRQ